MDGGNGCTIMLMCFMLMNSMLKMAKWQTSWYVYFAIT